jgi:hypothetical protein
VKSAWFFAVLMAIPASAQSSTPHGTRIGQVQTQYLQGPASDQTAFKTLTREEALKRERELEAARSASLLPFGVPMPRDRGPHAEFETWVEQLSRDYAESVVSGDTGVEREGGKASVHRFVRDNFRHVSLTYTMTFEAVPGTETFRVSFSDATIPYPVAQIVRDGETIALNLAIDARTGRRMVDYIRVGTGLMRPRQDTARDVYAEDAELSLTQPHFRANGVEQPTGDAPAALSAPVIRVDIPGQGRYLLSFKPRAGEGFEKAGEVAENSLVFWSGGNIFRIDCTDRIATGSGTYNIYTRKESGEDPGHVMFSEQR